VIFNWNKQAYGVGVGTHDVLSWANQNKGGTKMIAQAQVWLKTGPHDASRVDTTLQTYYCLSATNHSSRLSHAMAIWHFFLSLQTTTIFDHFHPLHSCNGVLYKYSRAPQFIDKYLCLSKWRSIWVIYVKKYSLYNNLDFKNLLQVKISLYLIKIFDFKFFNVCF
jgi:hypothetical protein